ncbi:helicase HerA-like domain-containing protein [Apibacter adventoris]|uniref:ATPase n=1 Tax=Apibacter adventoris TaxID=1679466 RepID=A0A2S8AGI9_9FLAO|nr:helicase HerA-like domain-containing protein [Apibacter adventoris]PQL95376.1 ATPase [Apibacter adventoris]
MKEQFIEEFNNRYSYKGDKIVLGKGIFEGEVIPEVEISVPLKMLNRHGLIAGATGTGKTKSLQILAEQLSIKGIPTLLMDIKGDLSGLAEPGDSNSSKIHERYEKLKMQYSAKSFPVELLSISDEKGVRLRATITEFGPILLSKILNLNDTQTSILSIIFKYCDDKKLPLIDLDDLRKVLQFVTENEQGKSELVQNYGSIASSSLSTILRNIVALEQQGASRFFGEPSFDTQDLLQKRNNLGVINIIRLADIQSYPQFFSTFMLSLLSEIYQTFPEVGDLDKPKLIIFIDEAHLIFNEASKVLLNQIETIIKLIRSKGIGIYFCTQVPGDIPEGVLSQLGLKIQHALRGFTAKDKKEINKEVENYPTSIYYNTSELIQQLGIGEAFITSLDEKGIPTPLADTFMISPSSRMDILSSSEIDTLVNNSDLVKKYAQDINKESAYEILSGRMNSNYTNMTKNKETVSETKNAEKHSPSLFETIMNSPFVRDISRTFIREGSKAFFGTLGIKNKRNAKK